MKLRALGRLALPAAAVAAIGMLPITQGGLHSATLGLQAAPLAASITPITGSTDPTHVDRLIGFNDVHGYLQAGTAGNLLGTPAGGARQLVRQVEMLKGGAPEAGNTALVGAGDQVGASPLASGVYDDEPTIDELHDLGLDYTSVGNHEFDKGSAAVLRQQDGGCSLQSSSPAAGGYTVSAPTVARQCTFTYSDSSGAQAPGAFVGLGRSDTSDSPSQPYDVKGITSGYLAANVVAAPAGQRGGVTEPAAQSDPSGYPKPLFPAYGVKTFPNGTKVGFIGEVLASTPSLVTPTGVTGLDFLDEATVANFYASQLQAQGVNTIVLLIHQGGAQQGGSPPNTVDTCNGFTGDIRPILDNLAPSISVIVSGHTHQAYDCSVPTPANGTKLVTSAAKYSQALTALDLTIDTTNDKLVSASAKNVTVDTQALTYTNDVNPAPPTPAATYDYCSPTLASTTTPPASEALSTPLDTSGATDPAYVHARNIECAAEAESATQANQVVGAISAPITRSTANGVESPLGDVIADAQLASTRAQGAVIAFMNPGGVRNDLTPAGPVTYGEAFSAQPFGDSLVTMGLTGAQIKVVLEEQLQGACNPSQTYNKFLPVSAGFTYTLNFNATTCDGVVASVALNGVPIDPARTYIVQANNYLAAGGDNFTEFTQGTNMTGGAQDIDAFVAYLGTYSAAAPLSPPVTNRVTVIGAVPTSFSPAPSPAVPEAPLAIGLPLGAVLIGGAIVVVRRRRSAPTAV